jgi:hypothetical protein
VDKAELRQHLQRHLLATLRRHGVSPCEDAVLGIVHYHINLSADGIAEYAKLYDENDGNPLGDYPPEDYLRAVGSCVAKGWLAVLTPEHFEQEARRLALSDVPEVIDDVYRPGQVAFTEAGFLLHQTLRVEAFGPEFLEREYGGWNWDEGRHRFDVYGSSEEECRSVLEDIERDLPDILGRPGRVAGVEGPRPIGAWRPCRFLTVPSEYHAVVRVELLDPPGGG